MGNKTIIILGLLVSALYIYFVVNTFQLKTQNVVRLPQVEDKLPSIESLELLTKKINKETKDINKSIKTVDQINNNRISIPAFGFISTVHNYQIVALLSDHDKNGTLSKTIEKLCSNENCINDLRYHKDVIDANWQEPISNILNLITTDQIKDGSLFIEDNRVKIEGSIYDKNSTIKLTKNINKLYTFNLKVENKTEDLTNKGENNDTNL